MDPEVMVLEDGDYEVVPSGEGDVDQEAPTLPYGLPDTEDDHNRPTLIPPSSAT